jgi:pyrroline-5-carboxylate reductase
VSAKGKKIGFLGGGNMGEALIRGLLKTGLIPPRDLFVTDVRLERLEELGRTYGLHTLSDNPLLVRRVDVVILAVKPQILATVLQEIAPVTPGKLLVSIAAGVSTNAIREHLPAGARLIRVMPNTPALVLEGATAIARGDGLEPGDLETAQEIFAAVGKVVVLEEELMDAVTGLSGSGPAYIALVVEALADGGVKVGLDRQTAMTLAAQTVLGAARLLIETGTHPGQLKDMVTSPGGTAIAGIHTLESGGLRRTLIDAVERATQRSRDLGAAGRRPPQGHGPA